MAHDNSYHFQLPTSDPNFRRQVQLWADEARRDIAEAVVTTRRTIARSQELIADVDRLLARR